MAKAATPTRRKQINIDERVLAALARWQHEQSKSLDALADEAFRDLLKKHARPLTLREALGQSLRTVAANEQDGASIHRLPRKKR